MGKRALLDRDWAHLGELMVENHEISQDLGGSGPENDRLIDAALDAGAYGAKLAGAGHGGTIIALTTEPDRTVDALLEAGATRILIPQPSPGVTVTPLKTAADRKRAEEELSRHAQQEDFHP